MKIFGLILQMTWASSIFGFFVFTLLVSSSFFLWRLYYKWKKKRKAEKEEAEKGAEDDFDVSKLLDTSRDKDYLHGTTDRYDWSQNEHEVEMHVKIPADKFESDVILTKKDVSCSIKPEKIFISIRGDTLLEGDLYAPVDPDECNWQIDKSAETMSIWVTLYKKVPTLRKHHWKCVILGDEEVDTNHLGAPIFKIGNDPNEMRSALARVNNYKKGK